MPDWITTDALVIIGIILGVVLLVLFTFLSFWKKVPQDKAMIVTGMRKRVISGGGGFVIPVLERTDKISLENMKIEVRIAGAMTSQGVAISADGVAVIKIKSDKESILAAMEQFNRGSESRTITVIEEISRYVLEGKLREIISMLTVEEIYRDRTKFASEVQGTAAQDLTEMGLEIKTFTIRDISDENGYLSALGKKRISEVKRDAQIAEAEAAKETKIRTAEASRLGEEARLIAETQVAEAQKTKELKVQAFRKEQETSKAVADLAYEIESNKVKKEVTETNMQVEIIQKGKEIELAEQEAKRKERELEATIIKQADAEKYRLEKEADVAKYREVATAQARSEAIRLEGASRAEAKRLEGMAEVEIIREQGVAEAEAMMKKAEAFKQYNDAAVTQMIIERLPEIAKNVAEPLGKTEKIVVIDNGGGGQGGGASKVSGYVTDIIATLPSTVEALTGIDIMGKLKEGIDRNSNNDKK
ncbi:MAG: SPFH domain-containing protein [Defluviitaleaceae bacterium]|nr:SPFH domain-containing protein [Defluviitaleaceae bacterium]